MSCSIGTGRVLIVLSSRKLNIAMNKILLFSVLLFLMTFEIQAQTTGSYTLNVTFPQADYQVNRNLYFFVPTDYDATQSYKLVVGFRGGPHTNAGQFRDQLTFLSDSLNAIILCPENSHHFNNEEGLVKRLFNYSVDTAMSIYNIDSDFIYLTGLSYGGRHAVIVSMDTDAGEIPSIRGVIPFAAGSNSHLQPDYEDVGNFPPACICIGLSDNSNFINVSRTLHMDIVDANGIAHLNEIPDVGHTVVFNGYPDEMMECISFIEDSYSSVRVSFDLSDLGILISPNPVHDLLFINKYSDETIDEYYLTDMRGRRVKSIAKGATDVNVLGLPRGQYFFMVRQGQHLFAQQITLIP